MDINVLAPVLVALLTDPAVRARLLSPGSALEQALVDFVRQGISSSTAVQTAMEEMTAHRVAVEKIFASSNRLKKEMDEIGEWLADVRVVFDQVEPTLEETGRMALSARAYGRDSLHRAEEAYARRRQLIQILTDLTGLSEGHVRVSAEQLQEVAKVFDTLAEDLWQMFNSDVYRGLPTLISIGNKDKEGFSEDFLDLADRVLKRRSMKTVRSKFLEGLTDDERKKYMHVISPTYRQGNERTGSYRIVRPGIMTLDGRKVELTQVKVIDR